MSKLVSHKWRWAPKAVAALALATAMTAQAASAAVVLSIPKTYVVAPGGTVTVSVNLDTTGESAAIDVGGLGVALQYDDLVPSGVFTISNIVKGSLLDAGWGLAFNTSNPGILTASFAYGSNPFSQTIAANTVGSILTFDLTLSGSPSDPGAYPINLLPNFNAQTTNVTDTIDTNRITTMPTASPNDGVDGLITNLNSIPEPSQYAMAGLLVGLGGISHLWNRRRVKSDAKA